jgi:hypothetical protein
MREEEALLSYLRGKLSFEELATAVTKFFTFDFRNDSRAVHCAADVPFELEVHPQDLRPMLESFLSGEKSAADVSRWASVVVLIPAYVRPEGSGRRNDASEYMWELLYDLSEPPIEKAVNPGRVTRVLQKLDSIEHELATRH